MNARWALAVLGLVGCSGTEGALFSKVADAGTAWPTAASTGVTPGTALNPSGDLDVSTAGAVIENLDVSGCVTIAANDVIVRNVRIRCAVTDGVAVSLGQSTNTLLEHVEIDGSGVGATLIEGHSFTLRFGDLHGADRGVFGASGARVEASYLHGFTHGRSGNASAYGLMTNGGTGLRVLGNRIEVDGAPGAALLLGAELSALSDVLVEGNLLGGGAYTVYAGSSAGDFPASGVVIRLNRFLRSAMYGPSSLAAGVDWALNVWDDTSQPIE